MNQEPRPTPASPSENHSGVMTIAAHLTELRKRIIFCLAGICVGGVLGWFLYEVALGHITAPMAEIEGAELNFQTVGAAFDMKLRVSLWLGVLISSPWWIWQALAFIWPGMKKKERRYLLGFGLSGVILFAAGVVFGDWLIPRAVHILTSFTPPGAALLLQADMYLRFYIRLVLAIGLSFLTPLVLVMLNFLGFLRAKTMLRAWRWAVMVSLVFSAISNPLPSPWPVFLQCFVLLSLYFAAVGISALHDYYRGKRGANS